MTKSGPKFNTMMERFTEISLPELAQQYTELRQKVIGAKLEWFKNEQSSSYLSYSLPLDNMGSQYSYQAYSDNFLSQDWA
jgi:hypothetical protein